MKKPTNRSGKEDDESGEDLETGEVWKYTVEKSPKVDHGKKMKS